MNKRDWIVLAILVAEGYSNHRRLAEKSDYSVGLINSTLKKLVSQGYITEDFRITDKTRVYIERSKPRSAIILAAGSGLRMMPISSTPKPLLKINNQTLIERIIEQLHEVDITEIYVVVGYEMEKLEFLSAKYGVRLIYDEDFLERDSLHSLYLARDYLANSYVVPGSVWFARNPFSITEYFSWYAVAAYLDEESYLRLNRKMELVYIDDDALGNSMIGLAYLLDSDALLVKDQLEGLNNRKKYRRASWERALFVKNKLVTYARIMLGQTAYKINTYEDLRDLDKLSKDLHSHHLNLIARVFEIKTDEIDSISGLFKGMTNNLMRFSVKGQPYLLRIPGVGSNELTDRAQEAKVYQALKDKNLTDEVIYISGEDGYKIAKYWENSRVCNPKDMEDVRKCMEHLRKLHDMKLELDHSFNPIEMLESYEKLLAEPPSFRDYQTTKEKILELDSYLKRLPRQSWLCHIDPVYDNFLFVNGQVYLIDWEYAGMADPTLDIAMFGIYANYNKEKFDDLMEYYYGRPAEALEKFKVYSYAAIAGLLWSVWCEYKRMFGVNYGRYAIKQYQYARNFHQYATELLASSELTSEMEKIG